VYESLNKTRDGKTIWESSTLTPIFNEQNKLKKLIIIDTDITDRKIAEEIIREKNKDITDSINYAQKIQQAILPDQNEFTKHFPDSFVLFKPKDIVSGDFYWLAQKNDYVFYAAIDCTGHGVPGGFMSMLGSSLLNEIINDKNVFEPGDILDLLRIKIIQALKQKGESGENKDGMDMCLCRINKDRNELVYAAANNPLWIVRNNELLEFASNKQPVGISVGNFSQFEQSTVPLKSNDCIYIFTDGYADQFGGPKGKKFKYKPLKELLIANNKSPMHSQKEILDSTIMNWKGEMEQVDDILLIGIRI
jgi:serine phosphatase RsbU (regulator of sigma subunit)